MSVVASPIPPTQRPKDASAPWQDQVVRFADRPSVRVRVYGRRKQGGAAPLIVQFHGGGFLTGSADSATRLASVLHRAGAVVVAADYPLAPDHAFDQITETAYETLAWAYRIRTKLAGTGARVFVAGEEAGGNLAAACAMMSRDRLHPDLAGAILVSPMLDPCVGTPSMRACATFAAQERFVKGWQHYLRCPRAECHPYAIPSSALRLAGLSPTLVVTSVDDPLRDESQTYARRLRDAGVDASCHVLTTKTGWPESFQATDATDEEWSVLLESSIQRFLRNRMG